MNRINNTKLSNLNYFKLFLKEYCIKNIYLKKDIISPKNNININ